MGSSPVGRGRCGAWASRCTLSFVERVILKAHRARRSLAGSPAARLGNLPTIAITENGHVLLEERRD